MSRVGKQPVEIPDGVEVDVQDNKIKIKGPRGELFFDLPHESLEVEKRENSIVLRRGNNSPQVRSLHGLSRSLIKNMIIGVKEGYSKRLEIEGVGFRAQVEGKMLILNLGFSHPVEYSIPEGIDIIVEENRKIKVSGIDKAKVGEVAAEIRDFYRPEPYKGKGIRYEGERVRRKAGKTIA